MLFRKDIEKQCVYCGHCAKLDEDYMICEKKGVVKSDDKCHRFQYDPLKRVPEAKPRFALPKLEDESFSL